MADEITIHNSKGESLTIPRSRAIELGIIKNETKTETPKEEPGFLSRLWKSTKDVLTPQALKENQFNREFVKNPDQTAQNYSSSVPGTPAWKEGHSVNLGQMAGNYAGDVISAMIPGGGFIRGAAKVASPIVASFLGGKAGQALNSAVTGNEPAMSNEDIALSSVIPAAVGGVINQGGRVLRGISDIKSASGGKPLWFHPNTQIGDPSEALRLVNDKYYQGGEPPVTGKNAGKRIRYSNPVFEAPIKKPDKQGSLDSGTPYISETEILNDWKKNNYPALTSQTTRSKAAQMQESANPDVRSTIIPQQDAYTAEQGNKLINNRGLNFNNEYIRANSVLNVGNSTKPELITWSDALSNQKDWNKVVNNLGKRQAADLLTSDILSRMYKSDSNTFDTAAGRSFIREHQEKFARTLTSTQRHALNKFIVATEMQERRAGSLDTAMQMKGEKGPLVVLPSLLSDARGSATTFRAAASAGYIWLEKNALSRLVTNPEFAYAAARLSQMPAGSQASLYPIRTMLKTFAKEGVRFMMNDGQGDQAFTYKDGHLVNADGSPVDFGPSITQ